MTLSQIKPRTRAAVADTTLAGRYCAVRQQTEHLSEPLSEADAQVQSMPDVSPSKWHLAHVTWFFETMILERHEHDFRPHDAAFRVLFNSYYNGVGEQHPRPERGLISRPSLADVRAYRRAVDERMVALLQDCADGPDDSRQQIETLTELGLHHEQQHQELLLTDIKHVLSRNPLRPAYTTGWPLSAVSPGPLGWVTHDGGVVDIGHGAAAFAFDNETPAHRALLHPYALGDRLITNDEWAAFVGDGGYSDHRWWLSEGWAWVNAQGLSSPLYWQREGDGSGAGAWSTFTLHGQAPLDPFAPVTHLSYFEADAYARWWNAQSASTRAVRLPTEFEWEHAARVGGAPRQERWMRAANFVDTGALHPLALRQGKPDDLHQMFGDVWEWTSSSYAPYPRYQPWAGAVGEYNGKFMVNQYVLRGGSCATPASHFRATYRNFFPTDARWQFSGLRLACDLPD